MDLLNFEDIGLMRDLSLRLICDMSVQVHVRPSNINCNSLRSDFSLTKYTPTVLIGNWNEQRRFDGVNSVDPNIKPKGFIYNHVESVHHDRKCPPTMVSPLAV